MWHSSSECSVDLQYKCCAVQCLIVCMEMQKEVQYWPTLRALQKNRWELFIAFTIPHSASEAIKTVEIKPYNFLFPTFWSLAKKNQIITRLTSQRGGQRSSWIAASKQTDRPFHDWDYRRLEEFCEILSHTAQTVWAQLIEACRKAQSPAWELHCLLMPDSPKEV